MQKIRCPICGETGTPIQKTTVTHAKGKRYEYKKWYIYHNKSKGTTQRWCYLRKEHLQLPRIKKAIEEKMATQNTTQNKHETTQNCSDTATLNLGFNIENKGEVRGCRLAWSRLGVLGSLDPGSNPGSPTKSTATRGFTVDH